MTFLDHLTELRTRLFRVLIAVGVFLVVAFPFAERLFQLLTSPLLEPSGGRPLPVSLIYTGPAEVFVAFMKVSFVAALIASAPVIFWQVWGFVAPGLKAREKRLVVPFVGLTTLFFLSGILFGYLVMLPVAYHFLVGYAPTYITAQIRVSEYLSFTTRLLLACGLIFEFPLLVLALVYLRLLRTVTLARQWRPAVVITSVVAAVLTPGPDVVSMLVLFVPLFLLYLLSLGIGFALERVRRAESPADATAGTGSR